MKKKASCGRMKLLQEIFVMPRKYSHIQEHEMEILELHSQGNAFAGYWREAWIQLHGVAWIHCPIQSKAEKTCSRNPSKA